MPAIHGEKIVLRLLTRHAELLELGNLGFSERQLNDYRQAVAKLDSLKAKDDPAFRQMYAAYKEKYAV